MHLHNTTAYSGIVHMCIYVYSPQLIQGKNISPGLNDDILRHGYFTFELFYQTETNIQRKPLPVEKLYEIKQACFTEICLQSR